ncbi:MAG: transporter [Chlorobiaceae bacterium]|nr:transporter [Chlorobiaceae bacterium]
MQKKTALLAAALLLYSSPVFAAMPLQTDDTGTQGKGQGQIELGMEFFGDREVINTIACRSTGGAASGTLTYGLSEKIDLVTELPWEWYKDQEEGTPVASESGLGDIAVQLKWRFYENSDAGFSLALKPGITIPTGNENKGLGTGKVTGEVTLIATHEAELAAMHFNLGYSHNESRPETANKNIWRASIGAEINVTDKLKGVSDIGIETNEEKNAGTHPAYLLCGIIYGLNDAVDLDLGIRGGLNKAETDTTFLAGVTTRF